MDGIAHFAHLGGMVIGFLLMLYWRKTGKLWRY
jgi:membrane associated rhomboid family serine protease